MPYLIAFCSALIGAILAVISFRLSRDGITCLLRARIDRQVRQSLNDVDASTELAQFIEPRMESVLRRFTREIPLSDLFLTDSMRAKIKDLGTQEVIKEWPAVRDAVADKVIEQINIQTILQSPKTYAAIAILGTLVGLSLACLLALAFL